MYSTCMLLCPCCLCVEVPTIEQDQTFSSESGQRKTWWWNLHMRGRKYSFFTTSAIRKPDALRSCQYTFHKNSSTKKIDPGINYYRKHKQEQVLRVNLASVSSLKEAPGFDEHA